MLQPEEDNTRLQQLPEECVREVLLRLSDHKDLQRAGEAWGVMRRVADEQRIWRELCSFHFTPQQLSKTLEDMNQQEANVTDWQQVYHKLRRYVHVVSCILQQKLNCMKSQGTQI